MKIKTLFLLLTASLSQAYADTIGNYMTIANGVPKMEMNADAKAQAWARSARNIINITDESIAQTLEAINTLAAKRGKPLYCLKKDSLNATTLDSIIRQTYTELASKKEGIEKMTISEIAIIGLMKKYPCQLSQRDKQMQRVAQLTGQYR